MKRLFPAALLLFALFFGCRAASGQHSGTEAIVTDPIPKHDIMSLVHYPPEAIKRHLEGKTEARVLIDSNGNVRKVSVSSSSGWRILDDAASAALMRAKFTPATQNGKPLRAWFATTIDFKLPTLAAQPNDDVAPDPNEFIEIDKEPVPLQNIANFIVYPPEALRDSIQGKTDLRVLVGKDGHVSKVVIERSSGYKILDDAAVEALKLVRFSPALKDEKPVVVWYSVPINFRLRL